MTANNHARWDEHDDDFLRSQWGSMTGPEIARRLGRSAHAVQQRACAFGLRSRPEQPGRDEFMRLCIDHTTSELAARFGVTYQAIWQWARKHGCKPKAGRVGGQRNHIRPNRTTPNRLCYGPQPNSFGWPEWTA